MIEDLKTTLTLLEEEFEIVEFNNCYILFKSLMSFSHAEKHEQFPDNIQKLIITYLKEHDYSFEYINANNIGCDIYDSDAEIEVLYKVDNYTGFLVYKRR